MNQNQTGIPDESFGKSGVVSVPFSGVPGLPNAVLALNNPTKQILVAVGRWGRREQARLVRLNEDGSPDLAFGPDGAIEIPFEWGVWFYPTGLSRLEDGGWFITGITVDDRHMGTFLTVVRQDRNGQMVTSFGNGGKVIIDVKKLVEDHYGRQVELTGRPLDEKKEEDLSSRIGSIDVSAVFQDGKIVATTSIALRANEVQGVVLYLNADGSLDKSFNGIGFTLVDVPGITYKRNWATASVIQARTGKVLVCGRFVRDVGGRSSEAFVMRFNQNGTVDSTFNDGRGLVSLGGNGQHELLAMMLKPDDGVVAIGNGNGEGLLASLTPEGVFNQVFNRGQPLYSNFEGMGVSWNHCSLQADGIKLVVSGQGDHDSIVIARLLADGELDTDFGGKGWVAIQRNQGSGFYRGGSLMEDKRIVVCSEIMVEGGEGESIGAVIRYVG